ncbi:MAG: nickel-dependent hydrogenase large subunit [Actinobacteria bacterium]|nr:nickel-dependent hydrogenase large subunit [Actinomycetota bacterium]
MTHRTVHVPTIARVEGEGALHIRLRDGEILDLRLEIYEPPRFFEGFLAGRHFSEVPDIVPRICGICPVAYQMSAVHGFERLFEVEVPPGTDELRRILYCAEWIESHMLHVHLLAAPDLLGYDSAIEMAATERPALERGLRLKRLGNDLLTAVGGREIHPVSPRVGGFSGVPSRREMGAFVPRLEEALEEILAVADWVAPLAQPAFPRPAELVSLVHPEEYPINRGRVATTAGRAFPSEEFEERVEELQVPHSNALHARFVDGGAYVTGPLARANLNAERLTPVAREAGTRAGLDLPTSDPFASMAARIAETALALEESLRLIRGYEPPEPPSVEVRPRAGRATWITEAPRGMLYHRYDVADDGTILEAKIVPPTSQNLRHMEEDLRAFVPTVLDRSDAELTRLAEMVVRTYDPCISCATHFLTLDIDRGEER